MSQALLVMDVQVGVVANYGGDDATMGRLVQTIEAARRAGIPVIYVKVAFRPGSPEVSPNNKSFSAIAKQSGPGMSEGSDLAAIDPRVAPRPDEAVVVKKRVSAFTGSDLEVLLRSRGIDHLVLTGFAISGVVLSTLREAADRDYRLTVIGDCCGDTDPDVRRVLLEKLFPRQADVVTAAEWIAAATDAG